MKNEMNEIEKSWINSLTKSKKKNEMGNKINFFMSTSVKSTK